MNNGKSRKWIKIADMISNNMPDNDYQTTAGVAKMDMHWGKSEETETRLEPYLWQTDSYTLLMARKAVYF